MKQAPENHVEELLEVNQELTLKVEYLEERVQLLLAQLYGKKSEKMPLSSADQLSFLENELENFLGQAKSKEAPITVSARQRESSGSKALPEELERFEVLHDLSKEEKQCPCGSGLSRIGEETVVHVGATHWCVFQSPRRVFSLQPQPFGPSGAFTLGGLPRFGSF